jgi:two-component system autoinducer 1 sensor kinase/phosphatase LuxN
MADSHFDAAEHDPDEAPLRVLVVDDHDVNRRVIEAILLKFDCSVALAATGEEAVDHAFLQPFDLIIMDLHMPGMGGDEATRQIRRLSASRSAFIARWSTDIPERLNAGLYDGELPKPITFEALWDVVTESGRRARNRSDDRRIVAKGLSSARR